MGFIRLELNEDLVNLISCFKITTRDDGSVGIDGENFFGGIGAMEDMSRVLGWYDQHIPGTEEDADGVAFPPDLTDKLSGYYDYLQENLEAIQSLVQQMSCCGGITPGKYKARADDLVWSRVDD